MLACVPARAESYREFLAAQIALIDPSCRWPFGGVMLAL